MKFYLREMHGSFVKYRLVQLPDAEIPDDDREDEESEVLAHIWGAPATRFSQNMGINDFSDHYVLGPEKTLSGYMMGGHHLGKYIEITQEKAWEILRQAQKRKET